MAQISEVKISISQNGVILSMLIILKMLSFLAETLTGLIYHRLAGENFSFQFHSPLRSGHSPEQDFLRNTCKLCLKAVFPHLLQ